MNFCKNHHNYNKNIINRSPYCISLYSLISFSQRRIQTPRTIWFKFRWVVVLTSCFCLTSLINLYAQSDSLTIHAEDILNNLLDESSEAVDNSELYDIVEGLLRNPIKY